MSTNPKRRPKARAMRRGTPDPNAVAIIGMAGRFPGAVTLDQFWRNLAGGVESLTSFSEEELQASGVPPSVYSRPEFVRAGTVMDDPDLFDAAFFGIAPREAEILDPQHRLFLECAWHAIEDAGYAPRHCPGSVGVYAGMSMNTYYHHVISRNPEMMASAGGYQLMLGNDKDYMTTRVSYKLNLKGPSLAVQTACSTSLVAIQIAYHGLLKHQCDMALAGGASILFPQKTGYLYEEGMIFSPDGHCRPFDAKGKGIRSGPGVGVVVLKRLADAIADGDSIRAVIRGAAINNDGSTKVGYTAPSVEGQAEVIATAQALAGVEPETIAYVETHGTGTPLGDPIEIAALTQVFRARTQKKRFCAIGSVKSNIGHLDAAAGVAGLIKAVLSLEHKAIPPSLNFTTPNPAIDFENGPFFVNTELSEWPAGASPRRAAISSFGIGGTNAHVVLEEAPAPEPSDPCDGDQILTLSAKTRPALEAVTANVVTYLEQHPGVNVADVAYTLQQGREPFQHRRVIVCRDRDDALTALTTSDPQRVLTSGQDVRDGRVVFMFSGQGSQYVNMGRALYQREPEFRRHVDLCAERLAPHLERDIRDVLYPANRDAEAASATLNQTGIAQPALLAIEYALAKLWMAWGIQPSAMIGHSIGEYVAACLAGVLSLDDAATLVAARGRLMQALPAGAMLSVPLPEKEVAALLNGHGSLAAVNAPSLCTVSGPLEHISTLEADLAAQGVTCRRLHTSHAFHSAMMDPVLEPFRAQFDAVRLETPRIPFLSNRTGTWITEAEATAPDYWVQHLRGTVRFADGLGQLGNDADLLFLEVGPGNALSTFAKQCLGVSASARVFSSLPHAREPGPDDRFATRALARLWLQGAPVDWAGVHRGSRRRRVALPTYPFERKRYWVDPAAQPAAPGTDAMGLGKRSDLATWFYTPSWKMSAGPESSARQDPLPEGDWLVFMDERGLGAALVALLATRGARVTTVRIGAEFREIEPGSYSIDPADREHYRRLIEGLQKAGSVPRWLVHLWNVTSEHAKGDSVEGVEQGQLRAFYSLLYLPQALGQQGLWTPMQLTVFSNGMQGVLSDSEVTHPDKATVIGPVTVIPQEYPNLNCCSVDIELPKEGSRVDSTLVDLLLREAIRPRSSGCIAHRAGRRWERTYDAVRLDTARVDRFTAREGGAYLITGGTGGLGLLFAHHLAKAGSPALILTARSALPARDGWDEWLGTHDAGDRTATVIQAVRELEALGARVVVAAADVADEARMQEVIGDARARFGVIRGVIHAAGVGGGEPMRVRTAAAAGAVLNPKVKGTLVLESLLRDAPLDFFVLCSSINAVYSGPGAVDYCAANTFLDAFAHSRAGRGRTDILAINWDPWQEIGMAANTEGVPPELRQAKARQLRNAISPAEGLEAMTRVMDAGFPQVVVSTQDLNLILGYFRQLRASAEIGAGPGATPTGAEPEPVSPVGAARHARPDLPYPYVAPRDDMEKTIAAVWSALLGIEEVGIHDNFFDLGGHSLLATRVLARLQGSVGVALALETVFDAPTVAQMAERITTLRWAVEGAPAAAHQQGAREEFEL